MPCVSSIESELDIWFTCWLKYYKGDIPNTLLKTIQLTHKKTFPNIYTRLKILVTFPVTTCEFERTISTLRRVKTYTRSTMGQEKLNGLALLYIHKDTKITPDEVLGNFASQNHRRIEL